MLISYIKLHRKAEKFNGAFLHDPVAVIAAVRPGLFKWKRRRVNVVTGNLPEKGMTFADLRRRSSDSGNILIAVDLDVDAVKKYIAEGLK